MVVAKHQLKNYPICWQIEASGSGRGKKRQIHSSDYITQMELCNLNELERAQQSQTGSSSPAWKSIWVGRKALKAAYSNTKSNRVWMRESMQMLQ